MNSKKVKISEVKINENNPRFIKDDKFNKLVKSIKEFPQMLDIRPIVVNAQMIVLGGNMRLKACQEAGLKEVPVIIADNLTEDQQREFLIKDNVSGGEWDWDMLANEWDSELLEDWGLDLKFAKEDDSEEEIPEEQTYIPVFRFEVTCSTEKEKNKLMADLLLKGFSCTEDY
ncbi:ParB N-terminal domain-containing protein [Chryseobacterium sp.]|uniref:ParB N-terminal domain-containing protein n=1 Tax=Chryseobacterium sp. TaxID=1871047 RepID=UPI00289FDF32|nr:ParB N-terminal domain-containing protein [Chryseobacterium sp.]